MGGRGLRRGRRAGSEDGLGRVCEGRAPAGQAAAGGFGAKAPASAEPKRPAGVFGLRWGVAEEQREVPHTGKVKQG